ncbi:MAG: replication protein A [Methanosarcinales archaeon]|nr:replication protein A [Methanosarcinales archaeon]
MTVEDANKIRDRFLELNVDIPITEIEERLKRMEEFRVSDAEAQRSVVNYFLKENNLARNDYYAGASAVKSTIGAIKENNIWMDLDVKVVSLWDNDHPSISQIGLVGDSTGTTKFVKWESADIPEMENGKCYSFKNIVTNEYQGKFSIGLNKSSSIEEFDGDIEVADTMSSQDAEKVDVASINSDNQWVTLKAKVVQLWDTQHESMSQVGLIGDETGTIKFVKWTSADVPELVDGRTYEFTNVVTNEYQGKFSIGLNKSSTITQLDEDIEVADTMSSQESELVDIVDIESDNQWVTLKAKVTQLWDNEHESISQIGLIGDESGSIKFVKWASAGEDVPELVDGDVYEFTNVVTNEYQDRYSIGINKSSSVTKLDEDIEVGTSTVEFSGVMIDIQDGSGLIKRCPECRRALNKGSCVEHGRVEGTYDLRIKAILDDGVHTQEALLNKDTTESLTGISLERAKEMAAEALDPSVVLDAMREQLMGSYYTMTGPRIDRYILVESVKEMDAVTKDDVAEVLKIADGITIADVQADVSGSGGDSENSDISENTGDTGEADASDIDAEV